MTLYIYIYICIPICVCVYIYIYIYIYVNTDRLDGQGAKAEESEDALAWHRTIVVTEVLRSNRVPCDVRRASQSTRHVLG